jgi:hypothetical protein
MKGFIKKHFPGMIQFIKDVRTLGEYKKKKKWVTERNEKMHEAYAANLSRFHNMHKGQRCFIVGTGPSLRLEDVELLKNEITFGVNSCLTMYDKTDWRATYYGIVDSHAVEIMGERLKSEDIPVFFYTDLDAVYDGKNGVAFPKDDTDNLMTDTFWRKIFPSKFPETGFSDDITKVVYTGKSVVYAMLQIAVYMGFTEIYLLGVDCNYAQPKMYSDNVTYVDHKRKWTQEKLVKNGNQMLPQFEIAKKYADEHGIKIYNATRGGQLETFERVQLEKRGIMQ